jgi:hypothetical protein
MIHASLYVTKQIIESSDPAICTVHKNTPFEGKSAIRIVELTTDSIESCTMTDLLSTLRNIVDSNILEQIKQVYEYRNWVAHGKNQYKLPAIKTSPHFTFT